jgi:small subunit ribosomal protein S2
MTSHTNAVDRSDLAALSEAGLHVGYSTSRRNPTMKRYIFDQKGRVDIFDLAHTAQGLHEAGNFLASVASMGGKILFVGGKNEARDSVLRSATACAMPYVSGRWIGGALTNTKEIGRRIARYEKLAADKEVGLLDKYTKKERVLLDREMANLYEMFGGILAMKEKPAAMFVVDPNHDDAAVREANKLHIPVVVLANTDCDVSTAHIVIPGSDATRKAIEYVTSYIARAINAAPVASSAVPAAPSAQK